MHCCALVNHHHRKNKLRGNKQVFNRVCIQVQQKHSKWFETELWAEYIVHCLSQGWKGETWISFYLSKVRGEFLKSAKKEKKIVEFLKPPNTKPTQNSESTRSAVEVKPGSLQVRILWRIQIGRRSEASLPWVWGWFCHIIHWLLETLPLEKHGDPILCQVFNKCLLLLASVLLSKLSMQFTVDGS